MDQITTKNTIGVKRKKFYKVGEKVWLKEQRQMAIIQDLNKETYDVTVSVNGTETLELKFWEIDKLKPNKRVERLQGLDYAFNQVKTFHKAFNHPVSYTPTFLPKQRAEDRMKWVIEEVNEFLDAKTVVDQADAMIDCIYFALGTLVELGVYPQSVMDVVQNANMAKLWPDGKPRYREDGKIIKPDGWQSPESEIEKVILGQIKKS